MAKRAKKAVRKATKKAVAKRKATTRRAAPAPTQPSRVKIRMYRVGVGDCFLLAFPRTGSDDFRILIDCGVHQAQQNGMTQLKKAIDDVHAISGGKLDVVVGTHEHQDHLSGFPYLSEKFGAAKTKPAGEIWVAWTEDDGDALANSLRKTKVKALTALSGAREHMTAMGATEEAARLTSLLGFFGDGSGPKLKSFGDALKQLSATIKYHKPGQAPIELLGGQLRVFVLGPPRDAALIGQSAPSKTGDQVYGMAAYRFGAYAAMIDEIEPAFRKKPPAPFDDRFTRRGSKSKHDAFFRVHYWNKDNDEDADSEQRIDTTQDWRRIDTDWTDSATTLGLKLDEDTNNTSLVLAFEFGPKDKGGPVMLFAADAQVGNWLSWQALKWDYAGRTITGPDLLKRTVLYKVGHHASHNATLRKLGMEQMANLELALVPTDAAMAKKVKWGTLPWPPLLTALAAKAKHGVVRTDQAFGSKTLGAYKVTEDPLFYEIELTL